MNRLIRAVHLICRLFQHRHGIRDRFFKRLSAVLVDFCFVFFAVRETSRTSDTAADTSHTFDEVSVEAVFAFLKKSDLAGFNTVA